MTRLARLVLVAGLAVAASVPLTAPASASTCNKQMFPEVCAQLEAACQADPAVRELCRSFG